MWNLCKIPLFLVLCAVLPGCDELGWNPLDTQRIAAENANRTFAPPILLDIAVPTLSDSASFFDESLDEETGILNRRRTWRGPPGNDVAASLMELRRLDGAELGEPVPPDLAVRYWEVLGQRQLVFQKLYQSQNAVGPVLWRRFTMGPAVCVLFTQGWSPQGWSPGSGTPTRHLLGYYCAPSGQQLTDGQAETVVRAVRVREGDPDQSTDG